MLKNLKTLRNKKGISQQKLAEHIGISQQSINKYENYSVEPDILTLSKLSDFFGVSIDTLVGHLIKGNESEETLSAEEKKLLENFRLLNDTQKNCIKITVEEFLK